MLKKNKLLIDQDCPMCDIYGRCFRKMGWIDNETLTSYQTVEEEYAAKIDMNRARTEIALFDTQSHKTIYGINAMIAIVGHDFPMLQRLLNTTIIYTFLSYLYRFISYNRKAIIPAKPNPKLRNCNPDMNLKYRWTYIIFVAIFTGMILNQFAFQLNASLGMQHDWTRELYISFGQIFWQSIAIYFIRKDKTIEYLGNMSTVSMIGGILLIPVLIFHYFITMNIYTLLASFMVIVGIMFLEHVRRCQLLNISLWMTFSWVMYRTAVLVIIVAIQ